MAYIDVAISTGESDCRDLSELEHLTWNVEQAPSDRQIDQLMMVAK